MASPDENKSYLVSGRLAYGCDNLSTEWPHGGTGLGLVGSIYLEPPGGVIRLPAEDLGGASSAVIYVGGDAVLGASVENWDDAASAGVLSAVFPNVTTINTRHRIDWPATPGTQPTALEPLVFTPRDSTHPGLILYKAVPLLEESARLWLSSYRFLRVPLLFLGLADASDRVAAMGRLSDLQL